MAEDTSTTKKTVDAKEAKASSKTAVSKNERPKRNMPKVLLVLTAPFRALGRYFKGSWQELKQVQWPSRHATWGLTLAVILFTLFFAALILALDTGFQYLFNRILL